LLAKSWSHRRGDDRQVQDHDDGLTPGVLPETSGTSEPSAEKKACAHGDFEQQSCVSG